LAVVAVAVKAIPIMGLAVLGLAATLSHRFIWPQDRTPSRLVLVERKRQAQVVISLVMATHRPLALLLERAANVVRTALSHTTQMWLLAPVVVAAGELLPRLFWTAQQVFRIRGTLVAQASSLRRAAIRLAVGAVVQGQRVSHPRQGTSVGTAALGRVVLLRVSRLSEPVAVVALAQPPQEPHQVVGVQAQHPVQPPTEQRTPEVVAVQVATVTVEQAAAVSWSCEWGQRNEKRVYKYIHYNKKRDYINGHSKVFYSKFFSWYWYTLRWSICPN